MTQPRGHLRRLAGDAAIYGLSDAVGKSLSLVLFPIFTRVFTPSEYGAIEVIGTVTFLVSAVLVLGLDNATSRHYYAEANRDRQGVVLGSALLFSLLVYFGASVPLWLSHGVITRGLFGNTRFQTAVMLALAAVPFTLLTGFHLNTLRRLLQPWRFAGLSLLSLSLTVCLNLLLVWRLRWGVKGTYTATLSASAVTAAAGMWWTRRSYRWEWDWPLIRSLLRFGLPLVPASLCLWGLALLDRLFLVHFSTLSDVGLYSTANRLSSVLAFGVGAFQMAWGPFAYSISTTAEARSVYARVLSYYVAVGGLGVLGLSLFADEALWILTPATYHGAALAVAPLAIGVLCYGGYTLVAIGVNLANKTAQVSLTLSAAATLNVLLCLALIPRFGMMGAAFATAAGWLAAAGFLGLASQRAYPVPYDWSLVARVAVLLLVCVSGGLYATTRGEPSWSGLAIKAGCVGAYLAGLKLWGLIPSTAAWLWRPQERASDA